ncbi:hypothetical protein NDU88_001736 [Pleurodeles waltl]|uniref:Uncharacterized protein n=1 Tax=Pleurodeles waltl TaxID=8319 RepID=A0AAV7S875_PLEWA|nr:hypothetical protein NDU88_001736 [Pleurodeles waltl]
MICGHLPSRGFGASHSKARSGRSTKACTAARCSSVAGSACTDTASASASVVRSTRLQACPGEKGKESRKLGCGEGMSRATGSERG